MSNLTNVNVRTLSVIDDNDVGTALALPKATADKLVAKGYVELIKEEKAKQEPVKKVSAPKKSVKKAKPRNTEQLTKDE